MERITVLLSLVMLFAVSCAKSELETQQVSNVSFTPCKQDGLLKSSGLSDKSDKVVVEFTNKSVQIIHYNFEVPCDFTTVNVTHTFVNGVLNIAQQGFPNQADCVCHTDVSYTIDGISQNEVNVIFINGVQVYCYNDMNNPCKFENPLTDLPWLKDMIEVWKQNGWRSRIYQCIYKDGIGFLLEPCVGCPDAGYSFRNCEGVALCGGGGLSGQDNCSELNIDFENKKLIWEINN